MKEKLNVEIDYDDNTIEITKEGANATLHIVGVDSDPAYLGKVIGNYLLEVGNYEVVTDKGVE